MPDIEITRYAIENWISTIATGKFHYKEVLGLNKVNLSPTQDNKLRGIIHELVLKGICESLGERDGMYRPVQLEAPDLDWQNGDLRVDSGLVLPFDLRQWVFISPDTTVVIAGSKSSGKTGWLYRTIYLNMNRVKVILLTNLEGGKYQLRDRFSAMGVPTPAPFRVKYVTDNFHDFVKEPNSLYVIDYIDAPDGTDFYLIGAQIKKVDQKLQGLNSNAVIGLQKPMGRDIAFGGEQTLKVATLYIAMDNKRLKIFDAKVPEDPLIHPKNMQWTFKYRDAGTEFSDITPFYGESES